MFPDVYKRQILQDTYRYETPKVVIYNVQSMIYGEPQNEAYNRMTLDGLAFSSVKIDAIKASMTEEDVYKRQVLHTITGI